MFFVIALCLAFQRQNQRHYPNFRSGYAILSGGQSDIRIRPGISNVVRRAVFRNGGSGIVSKCASSNGLSPRPASWQFSTSQPSRNRSHPRQSNPGSPTHPALSCRILDGARRVARMNFVSVRPETFEPARSAINKGIQYLKSKQRSVGLGFGSFEQEICDSTGLPGFFALRARPA